MQWVSGVPAQVKLKQIIPDMVSIVMTVSLNCTSNFFFAPELLTKFPAVPASQGLLWNNLFVDKASALLLSLLA